MHKTVKLFLSGIVVFLDVKLSPREVSSRATCNGMRIATTLDSNWTVQIEDTDHDPVKSRVCT